MVSRPYHYRRPCQVTNGAKSLGAKLTHHIYHMVAVGYVRFCEAGQNLGFCHILVVNVFGSACCVAGSKAKG